MRKKMKRVALLTLSTLILLVFVSASFALSIPAKVTVIPSSTKLNITIISPQNTTYNKLSVPFNYTINKTASWVGYSLDNQKNKTVTGNTSLNYLSNGAHNIIAYANDTSGSMSSSKKVYFFYCLADANNDRKIDTKDLSIALNAFGSYPGHPKWNANADIDDNKRINLIDMLIIISNFGRTCK